MVDRINLILRAKNITARQFADEIGIQPSGMSHIISGRNRPSLDFVMKVINRYPEIDIKWLMFGEGEMYAPSIVPKPAVPAAPKPQVESSPSSVPSSVSHSDAMPDLFSSVDETLGFITEEKQESTSDESVPALESQNTETLFSSPVQLENIQKTVSEPQVDEKRLNDVAPIVGLENSNVVKKKILKVVILYEDHSFSEFSPE